MNYSARVQLILIWLFLFPLTVFPQSNFHKPSTLSVVLDDNYPPYIFRDSSGSVQGILPDIWKRWEKATGVKVEIRAMSWGKALEVMKAGGGDVIDTIFSNAERTALYRFSQPYAKLDVPVFFHRSLQGIGTPASLQGFEVGVKKGDACITFLRQRGVNAFREFDSYEEIISNAAAGKLRVFVVDAPPAFYFLYRSGAESDFRYSEPLYTGEFHRAVRLGNEELLAFVEDGFRSIPSSEVNDIKKRWMGTPLVPRQFLFRTAMLAGAALLFFAFLAGWNFSLRRLVRRRTAQLSATLDHMRDSEERIRTIFDSVNDAIFVHSAQDASIIDVNARMCEMYGYSRREALGLSVGDISAGYSPWTQADASERFRKVREEGPQLFRWLARRRSGDLFWVDVNMSMARIGGAERVLVAVRDVNEHEIARRELAESRALLETVFEESPVPMMLVMSEGAIVRYINKSARQVFGWEENHAYEGLPLATIPWSWHEYHPDGTEISVAERPVMQALAGESVRGYPIRIVRPDGREYHLIADAVPILNRQGELIASFAVFPDVTNLTLAEAEVRELNRGLEEKVKERTKLLTESIGELESFSYSVSHDLRAPLRAIDGFSRILEEECSGNLDEKALHFLRQISESTHRMGQLIDGILSLSRVSRAPLHIEELELDVLAKEVFEEVCAPEKGRVIRFHSAGNMKARGDRRLIRAVLENLLSNAVKFTSTRNEAEISFDMEIRDGEKVYIVRDNGCGFDMKYSSKLFGTFQRLHGQKEYEGNGIGLANVRRIIMRHGGRTWAEGKPGEGAAFYFTMPEADAGIFPGDPL